MFEKQEKEEVIPMVFDTDANIIKTALAIAVGSYFGWLVFSGLNSLFPVLQTASAMWQLGIGLLGIFILVKLGLRKQ